MVHEHVKLSAGDEAGLVEYQAISPLSVVALVLGLASPLACAGRLLWLLPVAAALVSAIALRQIALSSTGLVGRKAALVGLALAVLFGSAAPTRLASRKWILYSQARSVASGWMELVRQGQLDQAHQWTLPYIERQPPGASLATFYQASAEAKEKRDELFGQPHVARFVEAAAAGEIRFLGTDEHSVEDEVDFVFQSFAAAGRKDGRATTVKIHVVLKRSVQPLTDRVFWQIVKLADPEQTDR
jgi:hypothetical protein